MNNEQTQWKCNFTSAARKHFANTDLISLIEEGSTPIIVYSKSELSAVAEFIHTLSPGKVKPILMLPKFDEDTMESFVFCEPAHR